MINISDLLNMFHILTRMCFGKQLFSNQYLECSAEGLKTDRSSLLLHTNESINIRECQLMPDEWEERAVFMCSSGLGKHENVLRLLHRSVYVSICTYEFHFGRQILLKHNVLYK